jgi:hypothetical protein
MPSRKLLAIVATLALLAAALTLAGCGKKTLAGASAEETAKNFAAAIEAGKFGDAATAFDYITDARKQNENWDDIPAGERGQIITKLTAMKADELPPWKQKLGKGIKATAGQGGTFTLAGDAGSFSMQLKDMDGKWYISAVW